MATLPAYPRAIVKLLQLRLDFTDVTTYLSLVQISPSGPFQTALIQSTPKEGYDENT